MAIRKICVLGTGTMGSGIAQVAATAGFETAIFDVSKEQLQKALDGIRRRLDRSVAKGRISEAEADLAHGRLRISHELGEAARNADYVIEAIPEKLELKQETFTKLEGIVEPHCVLGTNTSTFMISAIAAPLQEPGRLVGIHFFNPVPVMRLIEVVMGPETSERAYEATLEVAAAMKKETVRVKEAPGFVTSRINALIGNEAFRIWEAGIASAADIDTALKLGLNHPMGPFEMVDLVGLDARLNNLRSLHEALGDEAYRPSPLLEKLVAEGRLGRKSGHGVYRYDADGTRI
jgi:3-hydroxybutyryl-CoA dehydrogenase